MALLLVFFLFSVSYSAQTTCGSLTIEAVVTSDYNGQDVSCADSSDGTICVNIIAGTGPYNYQWVGGPTGA
ncbi:MAG: SprB repeat-containing protein, partial [Bacteroidetes bacterium]|nr:SprB repeat-containing protein [Bacteroidota bacterium]